MYRIEWGGLSVDLVCGLSALEYAQTEIGSLRKVFDNLKSKSDSRKTVSALFTGMAICGYEARHEVPDMIMINTIANWMTDESASFDVVEFAKNKDAVYRCLNESFAVIYNGKKSNKDKYTLAVEQRMRKKKGGSKAADDVTVRRFYADALSAGLSYTEARTLTPSFIREMAVRRMEYEVDINPLFKIFKGGSKKQRGR